LILCNSRYNEICLPNVNLLFYSTLFPLNPLSSNLAIREFDARLLLAYWLPRAPNVDPTAPELRTPFVYPPPKLVQITWDPSSDALSPLDAALPSWVHTSKLVAKPDQLIKRRAKAGLLSLNKDWKETKEWITQRAGKPQKVGPLFMVDHFHVIFTGRQVESVTGQLDTFIVEPFLPHNSENHISITSTRDGDHILFTHEGGVNPKAHTLLIPVDSPPTFPSRPAISHALLADVPPAKRETLLNVIIRLYAVYVHLHFTYLDTTPLISEVEGGQPTLHFLHTAAKLDQTAESICGDKWAIARHVSHYLPSPQGPNDAKPKVTTTTADLGPPMVWPAPFGRSLTKEEAYIQKLDASTGASLKFTVLDPKGRIWTMVAGGGASVVYADAIAAHGFAHELANYGEYSGAPTESQTYEYAKTIRGWCGPFFF
jgi:ATP citrate (pro-S)-lyase